MCHDVDIRVSPAEFGIDDDKANCPVCDGRKHSEEYQASEEPSLTNGIG